MKLKTKNNLDNSPLNRKNILNNPFVVDRVQKDIGIRGLRFEKEYRYTLEQVANFYEVDLKTIHRYIAKHSEELEENGYGLVTGERLVELKKQFGKDIHVPTKTTVIGLLTFKTFLNLGMLLQKSEKARILRGIVLNIVIDVVSKKAGGSTKYINQRDEDFLISLYVGQNYKEEFGEALKRYVDMGNSKYPIYINKIYDSIFKEKARKYRKILSLTKEDNVRDTLYSEVLTTISMYETGLAYKIKEASKKADRKLLPEEVDEIFQELENDPTWKPQIESVRIKMASRDYGLRDIIHPELEGYIQPLGTKEFEKFLGKKSKELSKRIEEYQDVFKRLEDK